MSFVNVHVKKCLKMANVYFVDSDIIDVAALDSQSLEHSDYVDRARQYRYGTFV